ncbi:MAG: DUF305 domain-containing protein [Chloroflexi bacterium]|nr:MAG: DUF305 domain-containing protein [Chloroflexota bacterium]
MGEEQLSIESPASAEYPRVDPQILLTLAALSLVIGLLGYWTGSRLSSGPGADSPEVGFARDMMTHHAQAVDMATLIRDRTDDKDLRQLALDIMLTQQAQIGQMQGWLTVWGYPIARTEPAMSWMGMPVTGIMPGMATPEQLNQLRSLQGREAEALFLQLMIQHHRSGVEMAEAAVTLSSMLEVRNLAQSMIDGQKSEIDLMQALLQQKGFPPVPEEGEEHPNHP